MTSYRPAQTDQRYTGRKKCSSPVVELAYARAPRVRVVHLYEVGPRHGGTVSGGRGGDQNRDVSTGLALVVRVVGEGRDAPLPPERLLVVQHLTHDHVLPR